MKEWFMNTSWSCTPKACGINRHELRVGCDVLAYVIIAGAVNAQLTEACRCKLQVNQGGNAEIFCPYDFSPYLLFIWREIIRVFLCFGKSRRSSIKKERKKRKWEFMKN